MTPQSKAERVVASLDPLGRVLRVWPLEGGVSTEVTAVAFARGDGDVRRVVMRTHSRDIHAANPRVAATEYRTLELLVSRGLPVPAPLLLLEPGDGMDDPLLVVAYIDGEPEFRPADVGDHVAVMAATLAAIHGDGAGAVEQAFLPALRGEIEPSGSGSLTSEVDSRLDAALAFIERPRRANRDVLLHGDFWPGNLLWRSGQLVAVIDWEDAAVGDPLADLAGGRLEILWQFGNDAMAAFTSCYAALRPDVDLDALPYWDLWTDRQRSPYAGRWGLDDATLAVMRERRIPFVTQALDALA